MAENWDEAKGKLKEEAGEAVDDEGLEREGKVDQGVGEVKEAVGDVGDKAKDLLDRD